jgi:predicted RecB family nuclease
LINGEKPQKKQDVVVEEKKEDVKTPLDGLPNNIKKKFEKIGIKDTESLLDTTEKQMKELKLNKKELDQLEKFVKDYLSSKK